MDRAHAVGRLYRPTFCIVILAVESKRAREIVEIRYEPSVYQQTMTEHIASFFNDIESDSTGLIKPIVRSVHGGIHGDVFRVSVIKEEFEKFRKRYPEEFI